MTLKKITSSPQVTHDNEGLSSYQDHSAGMLSIGSQMTVYTSRFENNKVKKPDYMLIVSGRIHGKLVSVVNGIVTSIDTCPIRKMPQRPMFVWKHEQC
jgi:hypothetical protein